MQKVIEIVGIYFFIEVINRLIFQGKYRNLRYLTVFVIFLFFLFCLHYLSWKDIATPFLCLYLLLFLSALIFLKNKFFLFRAVLFAPVVEEIICRQYIFEKIAISNLSLAFIISILFFLVLHFSKSWQQTFYIVICGLILCFIQMKTGKVGNAIALHGLLNLCMIILK